MQHSCAKIRCRAQHWRKRRVFAQHSGVVAPLYPAILDDQTAADAIQHGTSVSIERNKNTIRKFFDLFINGRNQEMYAFLTSDAKWWVNGKSAGYIPKETWYEQVTTMFGKARMPMEFEVLSVTAEDDRVCLEGRSRVHFEKIQFTYENDYFMLFQLRDDHICSVREYLDTEYFAKVLPALATA
jgi:ketosteroid isomerase-like protein